VIKRVIVFLCLFVHSLVSYSQGEFNNWYFGAPPIGAAVTFISGSPIAINNGVMGSGGVTVNVSDSIGNLLFFSNGHQVYNRNKVLMPNGSGLNGSASSGNQGVLAVKKPYNDSIYYIFTVGLYNPSGTTYGLLYSILNMRLDGGFGNIDLANKNVVVPGAANAWTAVTGTRHHNNKDIWIVTTITTSDSINYACYLLDSTGLHMTPVLSHSIGIGIANPPLPPFYNSPSSIRISSDGTKLLECYGDGTKSEFCSFNNTTGKVTRLFFISQPLTYQNGNAEFSIDSKYLYRSYSTSSSSFTYQYLANQLDSSHFAQSKITIDSSNFGYRTYLQMGPDWKIYGSETQKDSLSVIQYPSNLGLACNYIHGAVGLIGPCQDGLPQFVQRYKAYIHHIGACQDNPVHFSGDIWPPPDSIHWNFGDPASGTANISNLANPDHIYATVGTYIVELFVRHNDNRTDTSWQTITIVASPQVSLGSDKTICTGSTATFDAGFCSGCSYEWKDVSSGLVVGTNQTFTTGAVGTYCVNVTNGNGCTGKDTVQLMTTPLPVVTNNPPLMKTICSGESTNISLTGNVLGIIFHWTATLTSGNISGFSADSGQVINQTLINSGATAGVVTYHITPKIGDCAGAPVDYAVTVNVGDPVDVSISASVNNVCAGIPVTFNATPTNPGSNPAYQWKVNAASAGLNSPVFTYIPANGDVVQCILTSSNTVCVSNNPATSNSITMVVNPLQPVSVVVSTSANPVCAGTAVTFNAMPTNGGTIPVYQWKVNGVNTGSNLPAYSYTPVNGDAVSCILASNTNCPVGNPASSIPINMIVHPLLPVSISISPSANPFCLGNPVTYTAVPVNGGTSPTYQWKVNGTNAGLNNSVFTYTPANGDAVTSVLSSSELCPTGNPASSNSITMVVNTSLPAGLAIASSANPFCPGSPVVFTASPANGGSLPGYQWKVNGTNVGGNSATYTYSPANGDSVRCVMTSNLNCVTGNPASSAKIFMLGTLAPTVIFTSCFDTLTTVNAKPYKLKGGIPLGGTYSGPGVNSVTGTFTPSLAGTGLKSIVYTYTNVAVCSANKTKTIIVQSTAPFTCGNNLTDIRDAKSYPTVQIGTQCWMAANLNYGNQISPSQVQFDNCIAEKYCYNDNSLNCTNNGGLYQWDEMMKYDDTPAGQGLCPPGWHVPTETDWTTLFNFYLGNAFAGKPLQDTNITGFKALTSGVFYLNSSWSFNGFATLFWSSTPWNATKGISHGLNVFDYSVSLYPSSRANAFPVRCTKD